jgi:hypothetical protein
VGRVVLERVVEVVVKVAVVSVEVERVVECAEGRPDEDAMR